MDVTVTEDTIASTLSAESATAADTGLSVTFTTTTADEWVTVSFVGIVRTQSDNASQGSIIFELKLDAEANVAAVSVTEGASFDSYRKNLSFSKAIQIATAGEHTIKIQYHVTADSDWELPIGTGMTQTLQVRQVA